MGKISIAVFSCLIFIACQQAHDNDKNRLPFPNAINTNKSTSHINVPGTRVFLVPPRGFKVSNRFKGIEMAHVTKIEVIDVTGGNFYRSTATFTRKELEQMGYTVLEFKALTVNGFPGKMTLLRGRASLRAYSLVFGDSTFSTTIVGTFDGRDRAAGEQIRQGLLSVYYDKSKKTDLYAPIVFSLDDSRSIFKYAKAEEGLNIYSLGGVVKARYGDEPYVVAGNMPLSGLTLEQAADKLVLTRGNYNIGNIEESTTNGFPSLSREVFGELEGREVFIFQHVVLIDDTVVSMQGVAGSDDVEKYVEEFKKLTNTVSKKTKKPSPVRRNS